MDFKSELERNRERFTADLQGLIRIPSLAGEAEGEYPFGAEVQRAFRYMLDLGQSMGFEVKNVDNYGGHIDFPGGGNGSGSDGNRDGEAGIMAIVGHIDVVPKGDGWTYDPFGGTLEDGWIYGRGAQDDKGPTMAGLYAMKVLKDLGFRPKKTIRMILGLDEEANWDGMRYYLQKEQAPDFGIVPDADFPLVQCEKGLFQFDLVKVAGNGGNAAAAERLVLSSMHGGTAPNVVVGHVDLVVTGSQEILLGFLQQVNTEAVQKGYEIKVVAREGGLILSVIGLPAHAAVPERGKNAVSMAMDLIRSVVFANDDANSLVKFYNDKIGFRLDGSEIGCKLEDELSGKLTFNVGGIAYDSDGTRITVDVRYPVTKTMDIVREGVEAAIRENGYRLEVVDHIKSIYQESDHPVVKALVETYREISGDHETKPSVIGGATFARAIPNCMAYGALFPGDPELEHQKDEKVNISQLLKAAHIYAEAIYRLTR